MYQVQLLVPEDDNAESIVAEGPKKWVHFVAEEHPEGFPTEEEAYKAMTAWYCRYYFAAFAGKQNGRRPPTDPITMRVAFVLTTSESADA